MAALLGQLDGRFDQFITSHALAPYLAALPAREYRVLVLRFFHDMTQSQIGAQLGITQMQVSRLLSTTLTHLRHAVEDDHNPHPEPADQLDSHINPSRPLASLPDSGHRTQ